MLKEGGDDVKSSCFGSPEQLKSCNSTDMCANGRKERLCGVCEDTHYYYSYGKVCLQCARGQVRVLTVLIVLSVLVILLIVVFFVVHCTSCLDDIMDTGRFAYNITAWPKVSKLNIKHLVIPIPPTNKSTNCW